MSIRSRIIKAMSASSDVEFLQLLEGIHAADLAEVLETLEEEERTFIFEKLSPEMAADVLVEFDQDERIELIASYSSEEIAQE